MDSAAFADGLPGGNHAETTAQGAVVVNANLFDFLGVQNCAASPFASVISYGTGGEYSGRLELGATNYVTSLPWIVPSRFKMQGVSPGPDPAIPFGSSQRTVYAGTSVQPSSTFYSVPTTVNYPGDSSGEPGTSNAVIQMGGYADNSVPAAIRVEDTAISCIPYGSTTYTPFSGTTGGFNGNGQEGSGFYDVQVVGCNTSFDFEAQYANAHPHSAHNSEGCRNCQAVLPPDISAVGIQIGGSTAGLPTGLGNIHKIENFAISEIPTAVTMGPAEGTCIDIETSNVVVDGGHCDYSLTPIQVGFHNVAENIVIRNVGGANNVNNGWYKWISLGPYAGLNIVVEGANPGGTGLMNTPTLGTPTPSSSGGSLAAATYYYKLTANSGTVASAMYVSGGAVSAGLSGYANETCDVIGLNNSSYGFLGTIPLASASTLSTIASIKILDPGSGATAAPTSAIIVPNQTGASCAGTIAISSTINATTTLPSAEVSAVVGGSGSGSVALTWAQIPGATGYTLGRGTASGGELILATISGGTTTSYTDTGSGTPSGAMPTVATDGSAVIYDANYPTGPCSTYSSAQSNVAQYVRGIGGGAQGVILSSASSGCIAQNPPQTAAQIATLLANAQTWAGKQTYNNSIEINPQTTGSAISNSNLLGVCGWAATGTTPAYAYECGDIYATIGSGTNGAYSWKFVGPGIASITSASGGSVTGAIGTTCTLSSMGGVPGATAVATLTSANTLSGATFVITNSGYAVTTNSPTSATLSNGPATQNPATCSGTSTISSTLYTTGIDLSGLGSITFPAGTGTNVIGGTLGGVPYQTGPGATSVTAANTSTNTLCFTETGTGSAGAEPVWGACSGSAATAFSNITSSTNTSATMTVGLGSVLAPTSATVGEVSANYLNGAQLAGLATGLIKNATTTGIPSIAVAGTDYVVPTGNITGNAATATNLSGALSANQLLGSLTAVAPSGLNVPSCSTSASALQWTSGTGLGCNTAIAASTATTATNLAGGTGSPFPYESGSNTTSFYTAAAMLSAIGAAAAPTSFTPETAGFTAAAGVSGYKINCGSPCTVTLPSSIPTGYSVALMVLNGSAAVTVSPNSNTFYVASDGTAISTLALQTGQTTGIFTDGTNYLASAPLGGNSYLTIVGGATGNVFTPTVAGSGAALTTGPASGVTSLDVPEFTGTGGQIADSSVAVANLTTQTSNGAANQVCTYTGANKTCVPGTVTNAMLAGSITLSNLANQAADTFLMNLTAGSAAPTAVAFPTTAHGVLLAEGTTTAPSATAAGTSGQPLLSGGSSADPAYGTLGIGYGGTGATTAGAALINLLPTATRAGDILYCQTYSGTCTAWGLLAGNNTGTQFLEESSSGVPSWASGGGGDSITSPNSTLAIGGTSSATTLDLKGVAGEIFAGATPALTATPTLGVQGSLAGSLTIAGTTGTAGSIGLGGSTSGTATLTAPAVAGTSTNAIVSTNNISAPAFVSTVAIGTPPFAVTSTTAVTNLSIGGNAATATTASALSALTGMPSQAADTMVANMTAGSASPTAVTMPTTAHGVWLGEGTGTAPGITGAGTSGQPLISGGSSADPAYGTLGANYGGTGTTSLTGIRYANGGSADTVITGHQLQVPLACPDSSGSGTAQSCSTGGTTYTPAAIDCVHYSTTTANTGTGLTVNINSLGAKSIAIPGASGWTTTLTAGIIPANKPIIMCYDGTNWDAIDTGTSASGLSGLTADVVPMATSATAIANSSPQLDIGLTTSNTMTFAGSGGIAASAGTVSAGAAPPACSGGTSGAYCGNEGTDPTTASGVDQLIPDASLHLWRWTANANATLRTQQLPQTVVLHSNFTDANTTFTTVTDGTLSWSWPVTASSDFVLSCTIYYAGATATSNSPNFEITGPSAPTAISYGIDGTNGTSFVTANAQAFSTSLNPFSTLAAIGTVYMAHLNMALANGSNAGTVAVLMKNTTGTDVSTIEAGSSCTFQ
jgi:hypothetical protein